MEIILTITHEVGLIPICNKTHVRRGGGEVNGLKNCSVMNSGHALCVPSTEYTKYQLY